MKPIKGRITREQTVWCWSIRNTEHPTASRIKQHRGLDDCDQFHQEAA